MNEFLVHISNCHMQMDQQSAVDALQASRPLWEIEATVIQRQNVLVACREFDANKRDGLQTSIFSADGVFVVADIRLDDKATIVSSIGSNCFDCSDTELVLLAYRKWSIDCVQHLIGDFSFVIIDQNRSTVFAARDHVGTRTIFWKQQENDLFVTNSLSVLRHYKPVRMNISERRVASYLVKHSDMYAQTFWQEVFSLDPGHYLRSSPTALETTKWWKPELFSTQYLRRSSDYYERVAELLEQAVSCRIRSSERIGSHISGGIDSSIVTVLAARKLATIAKRLNAGYCWSPPICKDFPEFKSYDERRFVQRIADREGFTLRFGTANGQSFRDFLAREIEFEGATDLMDEISTLNNAHSDGTDILLSGWGGDEGLSAFGHANAAWFLKRGRVRNLLKEIRYLTGGTRDFRLLISTLSMYAIEPNAPQFLRDKISKIRFTAPSNSLVDESLLEQALPRPKKIALISDPQKFIQSSLSWNHLGSRMSTWRACGSKLGIEYRYPLVDRRLLEFILQMPNEVIAKPGEHRIIAKNVARQWFSEEFVKNDPANENLRNRNRMQLWNILKAELLNGKYDSQCSWLNTRKVKDEIWKGPSGNTATDRQRLAHLRSAIRTWDLWNRQMEPSY